MKKRKGSKIWKFAFFAVQTVVILPFWLAIFDALWHRKFLAAGISLVVLVILQSIFVGVLMLLYPSWKHVWPLLPFTPLTPVMIFEEDLGVAAFLRKSGARQNVPSEIVIFLAYPDWTTWEAWVKPHFTMDELRSLDEHVRATKRTYSYYPMASVSDVKEIMGDRSVREVYFLGHGSTTVFGLSNSLAVRYRDFDEDRHGKDFVHLIHCGTKRGRSLIDRVVPKENRAKCFFYRKEINQVFITAELKRRTEQLETQRVTNE